jgi:hypothetical protein
VTAAEETVTAEETVMVEETVMTKMARIETEESVEETAVEIVMEEPANVTEGTLEEKAVENVTEKAKNEMV